MFSGDSSWKRGESSFPTQGGRVGSVISRVQGSGGGGLSQFGGRASPQGDSDADRCITSSVFTHPLSAGLCRGKKGILGFGETQRGQAVWWPCWRRSSRVSPRQDSEFYQRLTGLAHGCQDPSGVS